MTSRPVAARARRIADITASVPEFTNRTCSIDGTIAITLRARSSSSGLGAPNDDPFSIARVAACTTFGCA